MTEALTNASVPMTVVHVSSAEEGLALLASETLDLILTDLHLPGLDGFGLLEQLKADGRTRALPVLVLTGSRSDAEVQRAYELHASAVLSKGASLEEMRALAETLGRFWSDPTRLPTRLKAAVANLDSGWSLRQ